MGPPGAGEKCVRLFLGCRSSLSKIFCIGRLLVLPTFSLPKHGYIFEVYPQTGMVVLAEWTGEMDWRLRNSIYEDT